MTGGRVGGLIVVADAVRYFVPATIALSVAPWPRVTPVPGSPPELLGAALHEGGIVPVLAIGSLRAQMLVCRWAGELVGLVGAEVVVAGSFGRAADRPEGDLSVEYEGQRVPALDIASIYGRVQSVARSGRWAA